MGNTNAKNSYHNTHKYGSQYSLSDLMGKACIGTAETLNKSFRSQSRASYRSWTEGTLYDPLGSSKTLWPVSRSQAMFLPEFPIKQIPLQTGYTFLNIIAKGAYGRVYKIQNNDTKKLFALKVISKAKVVSENGVIQARQEVAIQKLVGHHPFILNCIHMWQGRKTLYILTDYIGGGELFALIDHSDGLPENIVRIYVAEIALAINFLHNAGVIHRDIKSTNVLLDQEGHAVIIDFGLAKWLSHSERTSTLCGTPVYIAPEILKRQYYGHEADWWSLGVLACFMLTKQHPSAPVDEVLSDHCNLVNVSFGDLPPNAETLSPAAKDLLKRLLQPDPTLRLKSLLSLQRIAFYMGHDLQSYMMKKESPFKLLGRSVEVEGEGTNEKFPDFDSFVGDSTFHV